MNTPPDETMITRWIDGDLSGEELQQMESYAQQHPDLAAERDAIVSLRASIQENVPSSTEPPYPDFFNSKIMQAIESGAPAASPVTAKPSIWRWLAAPLAAGAMAACFFIGTQVAEKPGSNPGPIATSIPSSVYTPDRSVSANIYNTSDASATVIVLEGLEDIPDDLDIVRASQPDPTGSVMVSTGAFY